MFSQVERYSQSINMSLSGTRAQFARGMLSFITITNVSLIFPFQNSLFTDMVRSDTQHQVTSVVCPSSSTMTTDITRCWIYCEITVNFFTTTALPQLSHCLSFSNYCHEVVVDVRRSRKLLQMYVSLSTDLSVSSLTAIAGTTYGF